MDVPHDPRISSLLLACRAAKAAKAAAEEAEKLATDELKLALLDAARAIDPTDDLTDTSYQDGAVQATLVQQWTWRLDSVALKKQQPEVYAAFAKHTPSLVLRLGVN